jgi:hypothetical protein
MEGFGLLQPGQENEFVEEVDEPTIEPGSELRDPDLAPGGEAPKSISMARSSGGSTGRLLRQAGSEVHLASDCLSTFYEEGNGS